MALLNRVAAAPALGVVVPLDPSAEKLFNNPAENGIWQTSFEESAEPSAQLI
jgi:hypothetical protein